MGKEATFAIHTLGCKLNYSESSAIAGNLIESGYSRVSFKEKADLYIINTCSVTQEADRECRQVVRSALHRSPGAFIAVTGCYAQLKPESIAQISGVDIVLGAAEKFNLAGYIASLDKKAFPEIHSCEIEKVNSFHPAYSSGDRTRSFLKVQDGCDYSCSYCTIPMARGGSRSNTISGVLQNIEEIARKGVKEIVLTGVNLGDFREPETGAGLFELMKAIESAGVPVRFRLSSIEPNLLKDEMIEWVSRSEKFVPHFHIPLQSGSDAVLHKMRRRYERQLYADKVSLIKSLMPHCSIGVDIIAGSPGETEECFNESCDFLISLDVSYLHVFTFSERDKTLAALHTSGDKEFVPIEVRRKRNSRLQMISAKKEHRFYTEQTGSVRTALLETHNREGYLYGYTDNYIRVRVPFDTELQGKLMPVELTGCPEYGIMTAQIAGMVLETI